jgi:methyltransferase
LLLAAVVFGSMLIEARRAAGNERAQRARGGIEPPGDVYRLMRVAYPAAFAAMIAEGALRSSAPSTAAVLAGALVFAASKAIKWWAIAALGPYWTFRVIVVPGAALVGAGPYKWVRHPNYVGVMGELMGVALISGAPVAGAVAFVAFGALVLKRIAIEERTLRELGTGGPRPRNGV